MDDFFVIAMIFGYFGIPRMYQHRVLVWGIIGVIVLRGIMIGAGAAVLHEFHWVLYLFAAFLVITGIQMLLSADSDYNVGETTVIKFLRRHMRVPEHCHGERFLVRLVVQLPGRRVLYEDRK